MSKPDAHPTRPIAVSQEKTTLQKPDAHGSTSSITLAEHEAWVRLLGAEGITLRVARTLISTYGGPEAAVRAAEAGHMPTPHGAAICRWDPEQERARLDAMQATFVTPFDKDMPPALIGIPDTPGLLRVRGDIASNCAVAIVGTRRCSDEGERAAHFFARELARCGVTIVSGGARGIDAAAHRGALEAGGHTIVVLGCGLCQPYPPEHAGLYGDIVAAGGGLISEHHIDRRPRPSFFPRRNRLISGLSIGVLVVEAPRRSGAMLTARLAVDAHGRDCWAMLADGTRQSARGDLEAIRDGWAKPVLDPVDILGDLPCGAGVSVDSVDEPDGADTLPDRDDLRVLAVLVRKGQDVPVEVIVKHAQRPLATVLVALTRLQLLGAVMQERGCWRTTAAGVAWLGESVRAT